MIMLVGYDATGLVAFSMSRLYLLYVRYCIVIQYTYCILFYIVSSKSVSCIIFNNLKKLKPEFIIFGMLYSEGPSY